VIWNCRSFKWRPMFAPMRPTPTKPMFMKSNFAREKRIALFLFAHCRHRAGSWANDRLVGQREYFLEIVSQRILVRHVSASHRSGKERVAHNCDRAREPGHHIRHSARRMTPRQSGIDFQIAERKSFSLINNLRTRDWFPCWGKNIRSGLFTEAWQVCDMISVSMRKKNQLDIQLVV